MRIQMINEKMRSQEDSRLQALVSNERKREFLRYILHEIRVPLNALVLGLEGLKSSVDTCVAGRAQQGRDTTGLYAHRTPVLTARVQEEAEEEEEETEKEKERQQVDETSQAASVPQGRLASESTFLPSSPQRSPLPSPTLERSPVLFSNSSIFPITTSLSRASSLALSTSSSGSSPGRASPMATGAFMASAGSLSTITLCDEDADSINEMWHAVSHMTRLLDDVLSLQRIEDGELLLERRAFSLQETCVGAVRMMTSWLDNKGLTVQCDVDSTLPIVVSDEYRVRQVLINFLSNAVRFTPGKSDSGDEGRIVLTVKRCEVFEDCEPIIQERQLRENRDNGYASGRVDDSQQPPHTQSPARTDAGSINSGGVHSVESSLTDKAQRSSTSLSSNLTSSPPTSPHQPAGSLAGSPPPSPTRLYIRVSVHDSGVGIPLGDLQRMFTPFVQISSGEAEKGKGTGLGLSICRKLIDLLGGRVGVISAPGKGSTFFFEAPFEVSAHQSPAVLRSADQLANLDAANADEASSRTINKPLFADCEPKHSSLQLITSSLHSQRVAMHTKQKSSTSGDINAIPLHPANPTSLALAASSQQPHSAPSSPFRMVARALTVPPKLSSYAQSPPVRPNADAAATLDSPRSAAVAGADVVGAESAAAVAPAAPALSVPIRRGVGRSSPPVHSSGKRPLRVLVVDDADSNRKLLARLVSKDGAAVCEQARDGQEAVNMVQGDVGRYDVVLCDKEMPVMDGYGAVREMRRLGVACPIIGVTANALVNDQAEFIACGLDALVTKPVNITLLMKAIHDALQQRGTQSTAAADSDKRTQQPPQADSARAD